MWLNALHGLALSTCLVALGCCLAALGCGQTAAPASEVESTTPAPSEPSAPPAPAGKRAPCTLGADQTCNADESVSALWGRCTELGVCECSSGFELNPGGRCQPQR